MTRPNPQPQQPRREQQQRPRLRHGHNRKRLGHERGRLNLGHLVAIVLAARDRGAGGEALLHPERERGEERGVESLGLAALPVAAHRQLTGHHGHEPHGPPERGRIERVEPREPVQVGHDALYWDAGFLMGYSNSGYDEQTDFFIDDLKMFANDPGW